MGRQASDKGMKNDKRTYSRVAVYIQAWLRLLPVPDDAPMFNECTGFLESASRHNLEGSRLPAPLIAFLQDMDTKLQAIMGMLGRDRLLKDFPLTGTVREISGAGVRLHLPQADEILQQGAVLEIVLALSQMPLRLAGAMGRVSRNEIDPVSGRTIHAVEFTSIREADLDAIVGFVLQEERKRIRQRKWE